MTDAWYAVSDSTRRQILARVAAGPCSVGEITDALPVSMAAVSQHLKILREAGLVSMTPAGRRRIYQARIEGLAELRAELDTYWTQALHSFKQVAEASYRAEKEWPMSTTREKTSVDLEITVDVPVEHAFKVFTEDFDRIKPREHNMLPVEIAETVLEPRVGGRVYDRGVDGSTCQWARVLAVEPPHRLVISWDITPGFQLEPDPSRCSEVEFTFTSVGAEQTHVRLEHRHLDRHGAGWQGWRDRAAGADAWGIYLERFRALAQA